MGSSYEIVKDAVHGYIKIFDHERKIMDTPAFQRLRRIKQDTGVCYVYPCATHTRFSHSLGVMHIAGEFTQRLMEQVKNVSAKTKKEYYYLMRLWGLTHDIGHGPFSHLFDTVILEKEYNMDHEIMGSKILRDSDQLPTELEAEKNIKIKLNDVADLFEVKTLEDWPLKDRIGRSKVTEMIFYYVCRGAYSADIIDYLLRDSYFTGAGYGNIDWKRIVFSSEPSKDRILLDSRAEEAFDSLLLARIFMFYTVYYHRTTRAAVKVMSYFLKGAASKLNKFQSFVKDVNEYTNLDESYLLYHPDLLDLNYRKMLVHRTIPYTRCEEVSCHVDVTLSHYLSEDFATQKTRERLDQALQNQLTEEAFFVDTPKLYLNPMFGGQEQLIYIKDPTTRGGFRPRRIWETSWGTLSREIMLLRLYIHDDHRAHEKAILEAFRRGRPRPHY